jgi:environmental stress-induced protein Ves
VEDRTVDSLVGEAPLFKQDDARLQVQWNPVTSFRFKGDAPPAARHKQTDI